MKRHGVARLFIQLLDQRLSSSRRFKQAQSTLEWVIGAAIILGTLIVGIMAWNNGLVAKMGQMVQKLTQTS
jgi:hypothetical protein